MAAPVTDPFQSDGDQGRVVKFVTGYEDHRCLRHNAQQTQVTRDHVRRQEHERHADRFWKCSGLHPHGTRNVAAVVSRLRAHVDDPHMVGPRFSCNQFVSTRRGVSPDPLAALTAGAGDPFRKKARQDLSWRLGFRQRRGAQGDGFQDLSHEPLQAVGEQVGVRETHPAAPERPGPGPDASSHW